MSRRTIAIGDIHGCAAALAAVVSAIDPRPDDVVISLGDFINRGPDTRGVIDQLLALEERCTLIALLGNHEEMLLYALKGRRRGSWLAMGGVATLRSYGGSADPRVIPEEHLAFVLRCRTYYETESHIFVHANYDPNLPMDEQPDHLLRWESLRNVIPGPHRSRKTVIVGHTSQKDGRVLDLGYLKCIDTYCHGGGWLTALDVESGLMWQADAEGRLAPGV